MLDPYFYNKQYSWFDKKCINYYTKIGGNIHVYWKVRAEDGER